MTVLSKFAAAASDIRLEYAPYYLAGVVALLILKLFLGAAYNVFLHPLRKFPGPKLAIATDFYYKYKMISGHEVPWLIECHEKYGEVVRMGPDRLSYITSQAWKDIFGHRTGGRPEFEKDPEFMSKAINGAESIITEPTPEGHGQVRRIFANAFSDKALKLQEPLIRLHVDKLKRNIDKAIAADPAVHLDAVKLYNSTTFDIMGDLSFGEPLGMLDTGEYTPWVKTVFESIRVGSCLRFLNKHPLLRRFMKALLPPSLKRKEEEHFQHSVDRVDKRLSKGLDIGKSDIWKLVLENKKANLPLPEMHANASVFMIAGTETTATTLSGLTYLLLRNPDKMKKLVAEIRTLREEELTLENLPRLEYLLACLSETLRCYPPVPVASPRVVPKGGAKVAGEWIPENTSLGVTQKAAYSSSLNFKDAKEFVPERWLPGTGYDTDNKDVFKPFSFGPRNCIGMNLAYHEMRIIAALVLWHYDIELCPESENWMEQKTYVLWDKPELMVKFRPARK